MMTLDNDNPLESSIGNALLARESVKAGSSLLALLAGNES